MREIEGMPAAELMEWSARLKSAPWGRHRTERLHLQALVYMAAGPSRSMLEKIALPWNKPPSGIREVSREEMAVFLRSLAG